MNNKLRLSVFLMVTMFLSLQVKAQVTVGDQTVPQSFSILELNTTQQIKGLRLPQLTTRQRVAISEAYGDNPEMKGLTVFDTDIRCVHTWNGTKWIRLDAHSLRVN